MDIQIVLRIAVLLQQEETRVTGETCDAFFLLPF